jgi:hypothetical protein
MYARITGNLDDGLEIETLDLGDPGTTDTQAAREQREKEQRQNLELQAINEEAMEQRNANAVKPDAIRDAVSTVDFQRKTVEGGITQLIPAEEEAEEEEEPEEEPDSKWLCPCGKLCKSELGFHSHSRSCAVAKAAKGKE